jgi:hypothetical protein
MMGQDRGPFPAADQAIGQQKGHSPGILLDWNFLPVE